MSDELSEERRLEIMRGLKDRFPRRNIEDLLGGHLAGPASPDRPPVPVWDYLHYIGSSPDTRLRTWFE